MAGEPLGVSWKDEEGEETRSDKAGEEDECESEGTLPAGEGGS